MASRCNKCRRLIVSASAEAIHCTEKDCKYLYHKDCVGIPLKLKMSKGWTCPDCKNKSLQVTSTATAAKKQGRVKPVRKDTLSEDELSTTCDTQATDTNTSFASLPNLTTDNSEQITELKSEIALLKASLESANAEIDRLNCENSDLKNKVSNMENKIKLLNKIYTDTTPSTKKQKNQTPKTRRQNLKHKNITMELAQTASSSSEVESTPTATISNSNTKAKTKTMPEKGSEKLNTRFTEKKTKICILSDSKNGSLTPSIQDTFSSATYCHFAYPNGGVEVLLKNIEAKLRGYTSTDYCVILVGESDFKATKDYVDLVKKIRVELLKITHTNIVICAPTYICGAIMYNSRVELFNNLMSMDTQTHGHAYFYDTNSDLTFEMFSDRTGLINKDGIRHILKNLKNTMLFYNDSDTVRIADIDRQVKSVFFR